MTLSKFNTVEIKGIVTVVPEKFIDINDEIKFYKNEKKLERNKKILGLGKRHILPEGTTCMDLCEEAGKILLEELKVNKDEIDTLIVVSINHDYPGNSDACILQDKLGLTEE